MFAQRSFETTLARSITLHSRYTAKGKKKSKNDIELETLRQRVRDLESILLESTSERDSNRRKDFLRQSISAYYDLQRRRGTSLVETDESYLPRDDELADPESHSTEKTEGENMMTKHSIARRALTREQKVEAEPDGPQMSESQNEREGEGDLVIPNEANTTLTE